MKELAKRGITILSVSDEDVKEYVDVGNRSRRELVGKLYSEEFLNRVEKALADYRKAHGGTK